MLEVLKNLNMDLDVGLKKQRMCRFSGLNDWVQVAPFSETEDRETVQILHG